jgi:RNA polymerase sigma-70 factor (ECF subfamily)
MIDRAYQPGAELTQVERLSASVACRRKFCAPPVNKMELTRETAAQSLVNSKEQEFEELVRRHYRQAYNLAYRLTGNAPDAEDLTQEAFLRAFRFFGRYDQSLPFMNWFNRILTNLYIDEYRRRQRLPVRSLDEPVRTDDMEDTLTMEIEDPSPTPEEIALARQYEDVVQEGLLHLSPDFRLAIVYADLEGYSYEEIADMMKCSVGTVRSRIHRGRKQLRAYLEKRCPELAQRGELL